MSENVKNLKRLFGILLLLIAVLCLLSVTAFAAESGTTGDFKYRRLGSFVQIDQYTGHAKQVIIPNYIEERPVRYIGSHAFEGNQSVYSVKMPNDLVLIGSDAFKGCTNLKLVLFQDCRKRITSSDGNEFAGVGGLSPAKMITPRNYSYSRLPDEGTNVEWLGGKFDVICVDNHKCQDEAPLIDGKCDICGKEMTPAGSGFNPVLALGRMAVKTAEVVGRTVVKNTAKALVTTAVVIRSILKLF